MCTYPNWFAAFYSISPLSELENWAEADAFFNSTRRVFGDTSIGHIVALAKDGVETYLFDPEVRVCPTEVGWTVDPTASIDNGITCNSQDDPKVSLDCSV